MGAGKLLIGGLGTIGRVIVEGVIAAQPFPKHGPQDTLSRGTIVGFFSSTAVDGTADMMGARERCGL